MQEAIDCALKSVATGTQARRTVQPANPVGKSAFISVRGVRTKSWTLRCPDWSPHVPVGDQGARRGGRRGGVQPDRGGRAGRLQPHGRCKLGEGGGRRPAAPQEGRILALRQEDGARRAAGGRGAGRRPRRRGRRHRRCRLRLAPAAPRGRGALPHDRLGHRRPRAGAPRGALGARGAQGPLRGAGAAQRRPRGDDRHTKKRPRRRPVRPDGGGEGGAG